MYRRLAINLCLAVLLAWKVWYDDGTGLRFYHGAIDQWGDIPNTPGVQVVLVCESEEWKPDHPYRRILKGSDWYWIDESGRPQKSKGDGHPNGKWSPNHPANARAGLTISDEVFERYRLEAQRDKTCSVPWH